ncbi:MAG: NADH-quinone oxidoreductase subunit C [Chloroflexota bacterium]|nr:NADH-quinone oxidoreductase subunit C [Chloroflexota bacterium]
MIKALQGKEIAEKIADQFPQAVIESEKDIVLVKSEFVADVCRFLKQTPGLDFNFLVDLAGVDYLDYIEVVYHLLSLEHSHSIVLKTRCYDREKPVVPSVTPIWQGADFQEREIFDLLGVRFEGHYNMRRIFLWEGFEGYPLRRDFL